MDDAGATIPSARGERGSTVGEGHAPSHALRGCLQRVHNFYSKQLYEREEERRVRRVPVLHAILNSDALR
ncbi:hypothetical protein CYMTET_25393 [Cymbomonas tetramitiformis]|uniref:Uncharacterized protein n=1 Tax=Cymbomonas tetramitiformis TaxID=36881 RepID=A0AAE0FUM4_9CHLO|nr:hypothetical protein CYMTET_25393 [Cymbomonas tetramitiformis]